MSVEERAADIKTRLRNDMAKTLTEYDVTFEQRGQLGDFLGALMDDALHQIEPLLIQIDGMTMALAVLDQRIKETTLPGLEVYRD